MSTSLAEIINRGCYLKKLQAREESARQEAEDKSRAELELRVQRLLRNPAPLGYDLARAGDLVKGKSFALVPHPYAQLCEDSTFVSSETAAVTGWRVVEVPGADAGAPTHKLVVDYVIGDQHASQDLEVLLDHRSGDGCWKERAATI